MRSLPGVAERLAVDVSFSVSSFCGTKTGEILTVALDAARFDFHGLDRDEVARVLQSFESLVGKERQLAAATGSTARIGSCSNAVTP